MHEAHAAVVTARSVCTRLIAAARAAALLFGTKTAAMAEVVGNQIGGQHQMSAPPMVEMVRERKPIRLGDAKKYAQSIPKDQRGGFCGCFVVRCTSCPGIPFWCTCPCVCGGCLWYQWFLCACTADESEPAAYSCTDLKGIEYYLVKADAERGTLACFSGMGMTAATTNSFVCEKVC